jgi:cell division protein FtsQ
VKVEPRLEARRRAVKETSTRRHLRIVLAIVMLAAVVGGGAWFVQSPLLAVEDIGLYGVQRSDAAAILEQAGVVPGIPMVRVHPGRVEALLDADPWIADARVDRTFPHTVEIQVRERSVAAGLQDGEGWMLLSADGLVLGPSAHVPDGAALLLFGDVDPGPPGDITGDPMVMGAIEFVAALSGAMRSGAVLEIRDGELWARTESVHVRLGVPLDMIAKASALQAVLADGVPAGSVIDLIAPSRPALEGSS